MKVDYYANMICYTRRLIKQGNIYLNKLPKHEKHGLALQIRNSMYRVYELIVEGDKRFQKKTTLTSLNIEHEKLRMLFHLAFELGYFEWKVKSNNNWIEPAKSEVQRRYETISNYINELGRMIGGWIKHELSKDKGW